MASTTTASGTHAGVHDLVLNGLEAVHAATQAGAESADAILSEATHPKLREELQRGTGIANTWRQRIEAAQAQVGGQSSSSGDEGVVGKMASAAERLVGASDNHIIDAIYKTGKETSKRAKDDTSRDLGIIATGQLALHYYIAAFGTLASYLQALGKNDVAAQMKQCSEEAKAEDERHTALTRDLLG